jgi:hypothetical protein
MTTIPFAVDSNTSSQPITLRTLVGQLVSSLKPSADELNSDIINDISTEVYLNTDQNLVASVIAGLLFNTMSHSWNNCIRVYEKVYGSMTLVYIRNNIRGNDKLNLENFCNVLPMVSKLGGSVSIVDNMLNGTTVSFTFLNPSQAA